MFAPPSYSAPATTTGYNAAPAMMARDITAPPSAAQDSAAPAFAVGDRAAPAFVVRDSAAPAFVVRDSAAPAAAVRDITAPPSAAQDSAAPAFAVGDRATPAFAVRDSATPIIVRDVIARAVPTTPDTASTPAVCCKGPFTVDTAPNFSPALANFPYQNPIFSHKGADFRSASLSPSESYKEAIAETQAAPALQDSTNAPPSVMQALANAPALSALAVAQIFGALNGSFV
jgi:hypothetical protein